MPVTYRYEPESLLVFTYVNPVSFDDWRKAVQAALHDASYSPDVRVLSDRRDVTAPDASFIRDIVAETERVRRGFWGEHPVAILVAPADAAGYGMGRMQELLSEGLPINMRTFYDYGAAITWLRSQPSGRVAG
jgi:hypothetical protein